MAQKPRTKRRFAKFYADSPRFSHKNCVQIMISRFFTHRRPYFHMQFCTNRGFPVSCRRFRAVFARNSARFSKFLFRAEDFADFVWDFLHENGFFDFVQKKYASYGEKVCINRDFSILCRTPPDFGQKKSAQIGVFPFCAETCAVFSKKCLHKIHFSQFVQKIGLAGAGFQ